MARYKPVDYDPFAAPPSGGARLKPVDFDPFAKPKKKEEEEPFYSGFLPTLKKATGELGQDIVSLLGRIPSSADIFDPILGDRDTRPRPVAEALRKAAVGLTQRGEAELPEASRREAESQRKFVAEAKPGVGSQILAGLGRAGAALPSFTPFDIGGLSQRLLPQTPEQAAQAIAAVEAPFQTARGATEFIASQLPATAIPLGGGKAVQLGARPLARALGKELTEEGVRRGVGAGVVTTGVALNAASAGRQAYDNVIAAGGTEEEANRAYNIAASGAALASGAAARMPGLEQQVFSGAARPGGIIRSTGRAIAGEAPQEFVEEGGAQLATNIGQLGTKAEVPIGEDVLSSAALGGIGGGIIAAPVGAFQGLANRGAVEQELPPEAAAPRTAPRPSPPPADVGALSKALGPLGGKITLQEPSGPQEYTYQGFDEDGSVLLADADGQIFAEDPDQIAAAIQVGAAEPEEGLGGMAFGMDITEGLEEPATAAPEPAPEPVVEIAPAPEESIAPSEPKIFPVDKEVASYMDEYSRFRSADQMNQIMAMATDLAREKGKRSISRDELFNAAMQFDDQMAARGRPAPKQPPAPAQPAQMSPEDAKELADEQEFLERLEDDLAYISETRAENAYEGEDPETKAAYEQDIAELEASRQERLRNIEAIKAKYAAPAAPAAPTGLQDLGPELERIMGKFHPQLREMFILPKIQEKIASGERFTVKDIPDALRKNIPQADRLIVARALAENPQQLVDVANAVPFTTPVGDVVYPTAAQPQAEAAPEAEAEAAPAKRLTLTKATPTQWMGNQMGTQAATWKVKEYPGWTVWKSGSDWRASHEDGRGISSYTKPMLLEKLGRLLAAEEASSEAAPAPAPPAPPRAVGKTAKARVPSTMQKVDVQYELQDLGNIRFAEGDLQNRDRSRPQTQQFLRDFTSTFDPEALGEDNATDRGAPIINKDNTILSGNGRTMGLEEIYDNYPEQAEAYRNFLREQGYNIEGIERPVLVRRLLSDVDERQFVVGSNVADIAALSPPELARQDAQDILTPEILATYYGGDLKAAKNDAFVGRFIAKLSAKERGDAMDAKGNPSAQVLQRIRNALLYKAYGESGKASEIFISKAMERADDDTKTLTNALIEAANDWIKFQREIAAGNIDPKYDITDKLMEAVAAVSDIKERGLKVRDYLRSEDLVEPLDPFVKDILLAFHNDNVSRFVGKNVISGMLSNYAETAADQQAAPDMLGMAETPSAGEIWRRIDRETDKSPKAAKDQGQMFQPSERSYIKVENNAQVMEVLDTGTPEQMKNAIAQAQKPDDKSNQIGADAQKKNRGCD